MRQGLKGYYDDVYGDSVEIARTSKTYTIDCVPGGRSLSILDVGCGSGANSAELAARGHRVVGADFSDAAIEKYRARGFEGYVVDLESNLGFPADSFDVVFCSEVIEHMTSPEVLAAEMFRMLKPGGLLVLSTPNSAFWLYRLLGAFGFTVSELQHPKHFQFFSRRSLVKLLHASGFETRQLLGRNMYLLLPGGPKALHGLLAALGLKKETRFRTKGHFWHLSHKSTFWNTLLADTLIVVMGKR